MKKLSLLLLLIAFSWSSVTLATDTKQTPATSTNNAISLEKYRVYPFQWVLPEYYYKAETTHVEKKEKAPTGFSKVEFFGLSACIPSKYTERVKRRNDSMFFTSNADETIMMIKSPNNSFGCSEYAKIKDKDYCSAYKTPQDFFNKVFTLTPDTVENTGDKWIVHGKGMLFDNTQKIAIYSGDKFVAYVKYIKDSLVKETKFSHELTLFHANGPLDSYVTISFLDNDDSILQIFFSTLE